MIFEQIPVGPMENFAYVLADGDDCAVFDPGFEAEKILDVVKKHNLTVTKIICTHRHYDHINDVPVVHKATQAPVYIHELEKESITEIGITDVHTFSEGDTIEIGSLKLSVLHTPGHTEGSCCFLFGEKMITGDMLFVEGCGRVDLPGGNVRQMWESMQRLKTMDDAIEIYPGHNYGSMPHSSLAHEKKHNHFMRCTDYDQFFSVR